MHNRYGFLKPMEARAIPALQVATYTTTLHGQEVQVRVFESPKRKKNYSVRPGGSASNDGVSIGHFFYSGPSEEDYK